MSADFETRVRGVFWQHMHPEAFEELTHDSLLRDLGVDSLDSVEITIGLEDEFGIAIDEDLIREDLTFGDVLAEVRGLIGDRP